MKPKTKFIKFGWTAKTHENVIYVLRYTAIQFVKLGTKAKQAIYLCSTLESLSHSLEEQYLIITDSISLSTMQSVFLNFSSSFMTYDTKLSHFFGEIFVLQASQIKSNTFYSSLV